MLRSWPGAAFLCGPGQSCRSVCLVVCNFVVPASNRIALPASPGRLSPMGWRPGQRGDWSTLGFAWKPRVRWPRPARLRSPLTSTILIHPAGKSMVPWPPERPSSPRIIERSCWRRKHKCVSSCSRDVICWSTTHLPKGQFSPTVAGVPELLRWTLISMQGDYITFDSALERGRAAISARPFVDYEMRSGVPAA